MEKYRGKISLVTIYKKFAIKVKIIIKIEWIQWFYREHKPTSSVRSIEESKKITKGSLLTKSMAELPKNVLTASSQIKKPNVTVPKPFSFSTESRQRADTVVKPPVKVIICQIIDFYYFTERNEDIEKEISKFATRAEIGKIGCIV